MKQHAKPLAALLLLMAMVFAAVDVAPSTLTVSPAPLTGMRSMIAADITNKGNDAAGQFTVCINIDGKQYAALPVASLAPGAVQEVSAFWWPQPFQLGNRQVQVVADCMRNLAESDKSNNEKSLPIAVNEGTSEGNGGSVSSRSENIINNLLLAITTTPQGLLAFIGVCATAVLIFVFIAKRQDE